MKWLAALLLLLPIISSADSALDSNELLFGSVTYHFYGLDSSQFVNKLNPSGDFIANPLVGYRKVVFDSDNSYYSWTAFGGENSIGDGMIGGAASAGIGDKHMRLGLIAGTYLQNSSQFYDKGIFVIGMPVSSTMELTPILGFEFSYNIEMSKKTYFTIYQMLSPFLYTAVIGIGWHL